MALNKILLVITITLAITLCYKTNAQVIQDTRDLKDILSKKHSTDTSTDVTVDKFYVSLLPVIGYSPHTGGIVGGAVSISRLLANRPTSVSSAFINANVTSLQQVIINARTQVYLSDNKWFLQGDWRLLFFAQSTYGLGIKRQDANDILITVNGLNNTEYNNSQQNMRFNYIRFYEDAVRHLGNHFYAGFGIAIDHHFNIQDFRLQQDSTMANPFLTSHHLYSEKFGFDKTKYTTSGINLNLLKDTRDHSINTYKGYYLELTYRINSKFLASSQNSTMLSYDGRYFLPLSKIRPRNVLAFWSFGQFVTSGNVPYLALPSITWDTYNRSGRGYVQGRFRGTSMLYNEVEYRFPLSRSGLFGGVAFVNATLAEGINQSLFTKIAPAVGAGLRVKMDKRARINITVDFAVGIDNSSGIYFNLQEMF